MSIITGIAPTTELEAVNTMLSAIGEAPVSSITGVTATDVVMAINLLRNTTREILSMGWRFNMEFGYELIPEATQLTWSFRDSTPDMTLNVFTPPEGLAKFRVSRDTNQIGSRWVDVVIRPPRVLSKATYPLVFYDRSNNRDGLDATLYPVLYIDPVWFFDFTELPECARRYIAIRAARQLTQQVVGAQELAMFTAQDELYALRILKREEGDEDDHCNMFDFALDTPSFLGNRTQYLTGVLDPRSNVGPAKLASIAITQGSNNFSYGAATPVQFTAVGTDTAGHTIAISTGVWSATLGTITPDGVWTAPSEGFTGSVTITVVQSGITGTTPLAYSL